MRLARLFSPVVRLHLPRRLEAAVARRRPRSPVAVPAPYRRACRPLASVEPRPPTQEYGHRLLTEKAGLFLSRLGPALRRASSGRRATDCAKAGGRTDSLSSLSTTSDSRSLSASSTASSERLRLVRARRAMNSSRPSLCLIYRPGRSRRSAGRRRPLSRRLSSQAVSSCCSQATASATGLSCSARLS